MGTLIAWVLVRDHFPGKRALEVRHRHPVRAADDRRRAGAAVALRAAEPARRRRRQHPRRRSSSPSLFVTLPFVVRTVQPVLDRARPRGRGGRGVARRQPVHHLPARRPAQPRSRRSPPARRCRSPGRSASTARSCCCRATCRCAPRSPRCASSPTSRTATRRRAAAVATVLLVVARRHRARSTSSSDGWPAVADTLDESTPARRAAGSPVGVRRSSRRADATCCADRRRLPRAAGGLAGGAGRAAAPSPTGSTPLRDALADPSVTAALRAHRSSSPSSAVVINPSSASASSLLLVRYDFPGKRVLSALIDLPLSVSPVVVGLALMLVYGGRDGWFGPDARGRTASRSSSPRPGIDHGHRVRVAAAGDPRGRAGARGDRHRPGAGRRAASAPTPCQTFRRITLPAIKWAVVYGVVLSLARSLGEFGAVKIVSGNVERPDADRHAVVEQKYQDFQQPTRLRHRRSCWPSVVDRLHRRRVDHPSGPSERALRR